MLNLKQALIFVCRYPFGGSVKTRLAQTIGQTHTSDIYVAFLRDIFLWASDSGHFDLLIALAEGQHRSAFAEDFNIPYDNVFIQQAGDFGDRLLFSLEVAFSRNYQRAAVAASDAPELFHNEVLDAFKALDDHDISIIPAPDGGYSLLAIKEYIDVFHGVTWSTPAVLEETLELAEKGDWRVALMPPVADVDDLEDLKQLCRHLDESPELRFRLPHTTRQLLDTKY